MKHWNRLVALATTCIAWTASCDKSKDSAPSAAPSAEPAKPSTAETPAKAASKIPGPNKGPFQEFDYQKSAEAFQGSYVTGGFSLGSVAGWNVTEKHLSHYSKGETTQQSLSFLSPCTIVHRNESEGSSTHTTFAVDGDTLYKGLGSAAVRDGERVIACSGGSTYVIEGGTCTQWQERFGSWESKPATDCVLEPDFVSVGGSKLEKVGDVFLNQQMRGNAVDKSKDWDAVKAAVDAEQAK